MKCDCLSITFLVIGCVLLVEAGCQEQAKLVEAPEAPVKAPEVEMAAVGSSPPETAPVGTSKPKIVVTDTQPAEPEAEKKGPRIAFEKEVHDFGAIGPGRAQSCEFNFTNTGDSLLKITEVSKTCGCTPYTLAKKEYEPGERGTLKVKYSGRKYPGPLTKTLYVSSNDKTRPKVKLTVKGNVVLKVAHEPKELRLLLDKENAGCPDITLRSLDGKPFAIKQLRASGDCVTADYDPSVEKTKFVVKPKVDAEKLKKSLNGRINISLTHPECDTVTIPFKALERFTATPPRLNIFDAEPQKPTKREVWVLNNYGEDFEVDSVSSKKGIVKVLGQEKVGRRYKLVLEITPPAVKGNSRIFTDTFSVNIKGGERLQVACRGYYPRKKSAQR